MSLADDIRQMSARERSAAAAFVTAQANQTALCLNLLIDYLNEKGIIDAKDFEAWAKARVEALRTAQEQIVT